MVSATVSCGKMCTSWKVRAMPRVASATGPTPAMLSALEAHLALGRHSRPVSTLTSVDLPAPLGPTIDTNSPSPTASVTPSSAQKAP